VRRGALISCVAINLSKNIGMTRKKTRAKDIFKIIFFNIALLFFFCIVIIEIPFRIFYHIPADKINPVVYEKNVESQTFFFKPNLNTEYEGAPLVTNSLGLRDYREPNKNRDTEQVIILGDSFTFGFKLPLESSYPFLLEKYLNEKGPEKHFEVINAGVPGYSTENELKQLKKIIARYKPGWIILAYHPADGQKSQENFSRTFGEKLRKNSAFFTWFTRYYRTKLIKYLPPPRFSLAPDFDGPKYTNIKKALLEVRNIARTNRAQIAVLMIVPLVDWDSYPYQKLHSQMASFCRENGMYFIDPFQALSKIDSGSLWVAVNDNHYNEKANAIVAKVLYGFLLKHGR